MATVTHLVARSEDRYRINLGGTRAVFEHCHTYGVEARDLRRPPHLLRRRARLAALPQRGRAADGGRRRFPELADLVAADLYAGSALWRYPRADTDGAAHRATRSGRRGHGTLATFLRGPRVPIDARLRSAVPVHARARRRPRAIVLALEKRLRGVFNVAGPQPVPLVGADPRDRAARRSRCPSSMLRAGARPLRAAAPAAGRARAHQVPGGDRRRAVPQGDRLRARGRRGAGDARVQQAFPARRAAS